MTIDTPPPPLPPPPGRPHSPPPRLQPPPHTHTPRSAPVENGREGHGTGSAPTRPVEGARSVPSLPIQHQLNEMMRQWEGVGAGGRGEEDHQERRIRRFLRDSWGRGEGEGEGGEGGDG